jgi:8-oxo-dGTP pyrophosphatase MutT (NUDIX family)
MRIATVNAPVSTAQIHWPQITSLGMTARWLGLPGAPTWLTVAVAILAFVARLWPVLCGAGCAGADAIRPFHQGPKSFVPPGNLVPMAPTRGTAEAVLAAYRPQDGGEMADLVRLSAVLGHSSDPWSRQIPMHLTASALIVHPASGLVLLRWHQRQRAWLQIGGHGDPGETDPIDIVLREGCEETGLADLRPWPDAELLHVVIVPVPAKGDEPAHEHADLRFVLATSTPQLIRPESSDAPLRWLSLPDATEATSEANLRESLARLAKRMAVVNPQTISPASPEGDVEQACPPSVFEACPPN